jgi:hypothetical protein
LGAQRFPNVVVHREMLESGRVRRTPLAVVSHFAINATNGIQDKSAPFLDGRRT